MNTPAFVFDTVLVGGVFAALATLVLTLSGRTVSMIDYATLTLAASIFLMVAAAASVLL